MEMISMRMALNNFMAGLPGKGEDGKEYNGNLTIIDDIVKSFFPGEVFRRKTGGRMRNTGAGNTPCSGWRVRTWFFLPGGFRVRRTSSWERAIPRLVIAGGYPPGIIL
jgi:hypothetical protein